ncbi:MAG: prolyl oligopeptidase family serine peptidase [Fimbriimonadaceae bacterium]|nr:prolyl oligopeptidase family serine peptidase [Fimbriimonadaceae bacterium]
MNVSADMLSLLLTLALAPRNVTFTVNGAERSMIIYGPSSIGKTGAPLVFGFHGHGGNARQAARSFGLHEAWPEAIVVYMQGIPTPGKTDPEGKKNGWQQSPGDVGDRDIKVFDAAYSWLLKNYSVDTKRVYSMGHSNGGRFTWLLWGLRGEKFAAFAPSASPAGLFLAKADPKPVFIVAGEKDQIVDFRGMQVSINGARRKLGITGTPVKNGYLTTEQGPNGLELVTYVHPGGHQFIGETVPMMVEFFKRHRQP